MKISTAKLTGTKTNGGMEQKQSTEGDFSVLTGYSIFPATEIPEHLMFLLHGYDEK